MPRPAQLITSVVSVLCPYCGETQYCSNDNGSEMWTADKIVNHPTRKLDCNSCDKTMMIFFSKKVSFE